MAKSYGSSARDARTAKKGRRSGMRRVGRPTLGGAARQLIAIRIDPDVLDTVRREAEQRAIGYQTLINDILGRYVRERHRRYDAGPKPARTSGTRRPQE
jgi:uncharacterized protein (DUF4415 family)